jgi:hypothetical protein
MQVPKKRGAEPGTPQRTPSIGRTRTAPGHASCRAWSNCCLFWIQGLASRLRVVSLQGAPDSRESSDCHRGRVLAARVDPCRSPGAEKVAGRAVPAALESVSRLRRNGNSPGKKRIWGCTIGDILLFLKTKGDSVTPAPRAAPGGRELDSDGVRSFWHGGCGVCWSDRRGSVAVKMMVPRARSVAWPERRRPCYW